MDQNLSHSPWSKPSRGFSGVGRKVWDFLKTPNPKRSLSLLALLVVVAAIPLTVFVAGQRQVTQQRASFDSNKCQLCYSDYSSCENKAKTTTEIQICQARSETCAASYCADQISPPASYTGPGQNYECHDGLVPRYDDGIFTGCTAPSPEFSCSGIQDDPTIPGGKLEYYCFPKNPGSPWVTSASGRTCPSGNQCYYLGSANSDPSQPVDSGSDQGQREENPQYPSQDTTHTIPPSSSTAPNTSSGSVPSCDLAPDKTSPASTDQNFIATYMWRGVNSCNKSCESNNDCPVNDSLPGYLKGNSAWCYGFPTGKRCLQLQAKTGNSNGSTSGSSGGRDTGSTAASCTIGFQSPDLTGSCSSCINSRLGGIVGNIKALNTSKFNVCSDSQLINYWCDGGISSGAVNDCNSVKTGVCKDACASGGTPASGSSGGAEFPLTADIDKNGSVNLSDLFTCNRERKGEQKTILCDLNKDGKVTEEDMNSWFSMVTN